jgi:hypothetical protein
MTTSTRAGIRQRAVPWAWAALTLVGLAIAFFTSIGIVIALIQFGALGGSGAEPALRLDLAVALAMFGALGLAIVLAAARVAFGRWAEVKAVDLLLPAVGITIAIAEELALHEWAEASSYYDWDFIGWTAALSLLVVLIAIAGFGIRIAPRGKAHPAVSAGAVAAGLVGVIVASNLPALRDGIGPHSWPLVIAIGLAVVYIAVVAAVATRKILAR